MNIVITGASGVGKTALAAWLKKTNLPISVHDLDEYFAGRQQDQKWRVDAYTQFMLDSTKTERCPVLLGQLPLDEFSKYAKSFNSELRIETACLLVDENIRTQRLIKRGWTGEAIAKQREWLASVKLLNDGSSHEVKCFNLTGRTVEESGQELRDWITEVINNAPRNLTGDVVMEEEPKIVKVAAKEWVEKLPKSKTLREVADVLRSAPADSYYDIYHPLPFAELESVRTAVRAAHFRRKSKIISDAVNAIRLERRLTAAEMKLVDIGANSGGISFRLAIEGFQVRAVEPDTKYCALGSAVNRISEVGVTWKAGSLADAVAEDEHFDVGLLLSVFQWVAKGGSNIEAAGKLLKSVSLRCDCMIFEQGYNMGTSCFTTDNPDHYQELIKMLLRYTHYTNFRMLPSTELYPGQIRYLVLCSGRR